MTAETFHQVFDQLTDPILLQNASGWVANTAAQNLGLSESGLQQLAQWDETTLAWIAQRFYHVSRQCMDGASMLILREDSFFGGAAENVASQLRQFLQSAFGCTADLSQIGAIRSDFQARDRLSGVNQELYQLLRIVQELELSSCSTAILCRLECFDLAALLTQLADELRQLFRPSAVELELELEPGELFLSADQDKVKFMVLSLISNALVHLPQSGGWISLGLKEQQGQAVLSVCDNGDGFSPDLLSRPLWSEPQRLLPGRGLGLGLPLVQRIAAAHDGTVMVNPSAQGARVTVSLPIHIPTDTLAQPVLPRRDHSGFSMAKVMLSNALPRSLYYPDPDGDE